MREKLILEVNNLLGELMDDDGISDQNLTKVIHLKWDFEKEILGNVKVYAPFMDYPDPPIEEYPKN